MSQTQNTPIRAASSLRAALQPTTGPDPAPETDPEQRARLAMLRLMERMSGLCAEERLPLEVPIALDTARMVYDSYTVGMWLPIRPRGFAAESTNHSRALGLLWATGVLWRWVTAHPDEERAQKALDVLAGHLLTHWGVASAPVTPDRVRPMADAAVIGLEAHLRGGRQ